MHAVLSTHPVTQYLGIDVLDDVPDPSGGLAEECRRNFAIVDPAVGVFATRTVDTFPSYERTILWRCMNKSEIAALRNFIDARKGRLLPFWLPSFARDLTLITNANIGSQVLTIYYCGYSEMMFPVGPQRRYLRVVPANGVAPYFRKVSVAAVDIIGVTETLVLEDTLGVPANIADTHSFMRLMRLDVDEVPIVFPAGASYAEARISVVEVPFEVPA